MHKGSSAQRVALLSLHSSPIAPLGRSDAGGMNLYVRRLATGLGEAGMRVDVFTRRTDGRTPEIMNLGDGVRLINLSAGPRRRLPKHVLPLHLPALSAALREFADREQITYDLLHSHYWISGMAAVRYRVQAGIDVPCVHMFHTLSKLKEFYSCGPDPTDSALRADGERCLMGRVDAVVGGTDSELEDMSRLYGRTPARYVTIPPGVDLDLFAPLDTSVSRQRIGVRAKRVILFVGRLDRLKGLDLLLRATSQLPPGLLQDLKLLLVGAQERASGREPRYRKLAERLGLGNVVEFRGKVEQSDLPAYYSAADICAIPSSYESFGMVAIESMACQTPPVAFRVGGLATTITSGRTGILAAHGSAEEFGNALRSALTSSTLEEMGRRGRMSVQRYTWERTTRSTLSLYDEMLSDSDYAYRLER
ncbi:MAG: glycosyltransferase, partial [Chloroflexota bacterium]